MNPLPPINRRRFLHGLAAGSALTVVPPTLCASGPAPSSPGVPPPDYAKPNVILISGKYEKFQDVYHEHPEVGFRLLGARFESKIPTIFEQLRKAFKVPDHQTLIVNSEDRGDEEFYNFSNHHLYGANYRSNTLSLRRFKTHLLRRHIAAGKWKGAELEKQISELGKLEALDYRDTEREGQGAEIEAFWEEWRDYFPANRDLERRTGPAFSQGLLLLGGGPLHPSLRHPSPAGRTALCGRTPQRPRTGNPQTRGPRQGGTRDARTPATARGEGPCPRRPVRSHSGLARQPHGSRNQRHPLVFRLVSFRGENRLFRRVSELPPHPRLAEPTAGASAVFPLRARPD